MRRLLEIAVLLGVAAVSLLASVSANGTPSFERAFKPLLDSTCLACHSNTVMSPLNFNDVSYDLADPKNRRFWARVYDRVQHGEMPPPPTPAPASTIAQPALAALHAALTEASIAGRGGQRTALRRLTPLEYQYSIQDLLGIEEEVAAAITRGLPAEADSGGFDTVAVSQGMSALHIRSYLSAADAALDRALRVGARPETQSFKVNYAESGYVQALSAGGFLGGGVTAIVEGGAASYFDVSSTYIFHSSTEGFEVKDAGMYKVTAVAFPYRATSEVIFTLYKAQKASGQTAAFSDLLGVYDLVDPQPREVQVTTFMQPGDTIAPSLAENELPPDGFKYFEPHLNVKDYDGEGIVFQSLAIEGPIVGQWPPEGTRRLLTGVRFGTGDAEGDVLLDRAPAEHVREIVADFAARAFRRPVADDEVAAFAALAEPLLEQNRPFIEAVRVPLRAVLSSPSFLYHDVSAGDRLNAQALATRLAYFLWRTTPDAELSGLAANGKLNKPNVLKRQVERMLADARAVRFFEDFAGQAFRLYEINATTPEKTLYPEYDDILGQAMLRETELYLTELIRENMGAANLIDADFTFLNRRLADHYGIDGIEGQYMRKVALADDSVRGGLLTQGSVLKLTANGTTTSPVPRGNFVLANLLGQPAPPPPPNVGSLEPDTRGTTTIREQLSAHRTNTICASCHVKIDPPGLALESFDPVGAFRTRYRASGEGMVTAPDGKEYPAPFRDGPPVDASGVTPDGTRFADIREYKAHLLESELDAVATHFVSNLIVFATGAEIDFADRAAVASITAGLADDGYPMKSMIHAVVQSDLFRTK